MQFPSVRHGPNVISDSSCIFDYLVATYPEKMSMFIPTDAVTCVSVACHSRY